MSATSGRLELSIDKSLHDVLANAKNELIIISGPRRCGKTEAVKRVLNALTKEQILKDNDVVHYQILNDDLHNHLDLCKSVQGILTHTLKHFLE